MYNPVDVDVLVSKMYKVNLAEESVVASNVEYSSSSAGTVLCSIGIDPIHCVSKR